MPNPFHSLVDKHFGQHFIVLLKQQVAGLWEDFWADGSENLMDSVRAAATNFRKPAAAEPPKPARSTPSLSTILQKQQSEMFWHAEAGELSEKMWGDGFTTPGDATINNLLVTPLELVKNMSVLDLSAGLGSRARAIINDTSALVTALEPDAALAARGQRVSGGLVAAYDPANLKLDATFDAFIARELFYRVQDRPVFLAVLAQHSRPTAQIAFTDYIVDPEFRDHAAILDWRQFESSAKPVGLVEISEIFAKAGFALNLHEDLTGFYKSEITIGIKNLLKFLASGVRPDKETAYAVLRRVETWKYRLAALDAGMKFYRFYGKKRG